MKIGLIMLARRFGGAERYYVDLARALAQRQHDVLAISHTGSESERMLEDAPGLRHASITVLATWDPFAPNKLKKLIQQHNPDVVQTLLGRATYLAGKALKKTTIPLIAHTHDFVSLKYFKYVDRFIPATRAQRDYLIANGVDPGRIEIIHNFSAFQPAQKIILRDDVNNIIAHGRFVHKKGFDVLIKAFKQLPDHIHLHIAGDGPEKNHYLALVKALKLGERVHLSGWENNIRGFLMQGDLFVLPSREEPFGIALLEAMASGIPIITTKCHGPLDILNDDTAYFCNAGSTESLAEALLKAMNDTPGRLHRAHNALALYQSRYCIEKVIHRFEDLYAKALS